VIADDVVVTGSFNLSNHAMGNAENVLFIRDAEFANAYEKYIRDLMAVYGTPNVSAPNLAPNPAPKPHDAP